METSLPRLRGMALSARTFRRIALANAAWLLVIVATGATVRLTGSGLGCEHWPGCTAGNPFPTKGYHSFVEFSNRIVAGFAVIVTLGTLLASLLARVPRWTRWAAGGAFVLTLAEAPLGAITVKYHLNPWLVLTHFLLSLVVLGLGVLVALEAWGVRGDEVPAPLKQLGLLVAAACVALVVTGTLATAAGPHSGSVAVPRIGSFKPAVWLHVRATAVFGISFALLLGWLLLRRSRRLVRWALPVLAVLAVQMAVGEIQYRTKLPWWLVLVHVTLAASLWAATAAFAAVFWRPSRMR
jgi:cytochrome c oxidase assembly protein subunit 15